MEKDEQSQLHSNCHLHSLTHLQSTVHLLTLAGGSVHFQDLLTIEEERGFDLLAGCDHWTIGLAVSLVVGSSSIIITSPMVLLDETAKKERKRKREQVSISGSN